MTQPTESPMTEAGSHHGAPVLYERDIQMMQHFMLWIQTARSSPTGGGSYGPDWWPSYPDMLKSRLFWRIRSGKQPLAYPPPTSFSCPWYELIEVAGPHEVVDEIRAGIGVTTMGSIFRAQQQGVTECANVAQCLYGVISEADGKWVLAYGPYRFRAWNGPVAWLSVDPKQGWKQGDPPMTVYHPGGLIERAPDLEEQK